MGIAFQTSLIPYKAGHLVRSKAAGFYWSEATLILLSYRSDNQVEIYFSILQRKALIPNDFNNFKQLEKTILDFQIACEKAAKQFRLKFSRENL